MSQRRRRRGRFASGASPAPQPGGHLPDPPSFEFTQEKGFGGNFPRTGAGPRPAREARNLSAHSTSGISTAVSQEGFELLTGFFLGDDTAGAINGVGSGLGGQKRLQLEGLLDVEGGEFVAGLCCLERTDRAFGPSKNIGKQAVVGGGVLGDLPLHQGSALEAGVGFLPAVAGVLDYVVGGERVGEGAGEQALVGGVGLGDFEGDGIAGGNLTLEIGENLGELWRDRAGERLQLAI